MSPRKTTIEPKSLGSGPETLGRKRDSTRLLDLYDSSLDNELRPANLSDFVGQPQLKIRLTVIIEAARARGESVDHLLFAGPPGLGKTSLAGIVAAEIGVGLRVTSGPAITRPGDLAALLSDLSEGNVLFIDEIHRLPKVVEELLYVAMEDYKLDLMIGKGPTARSLRIDLPRFTLIGATTRSGMVSGPLRDRFGFTHRLEYYDDEELQAIVERSAQILGCAIDPRASKEIARRSRGTPRLANRLLRRVRDYSSVTGGEGIDLECARKGLELFGVDALGLDRVDREILEVLCINFRGRPAGLSSLSASVREEKDTIEDVYEPFLVRLGMVVRTPRGRVATERAFEHLGLAVPRETQMGLE